MLGYIRRNADSWVIKGILGLIAVVFIFFFGSGALNSPRSEMVVEVNGEAIREQEVNRVWRRQVRFQQQFNPNMTEEQRLAVRTTVVDDLIERRLMLQAAHEEGMVVSSRELQRAVLQDPSFQDDEGNFDAEAYERYLGDNPKAQIRALDSFYRERLMLSALEDMISAGVQVSDAEVREAWSKEHSKRDIEFVRVSTSQFRDQVAPSPEELTAWVQENGESIRERYDRDFDRKYNTPKKVQARHILLKFGDEDDEATRQAIRDRMATILDEVNADGADFAELASKYSEDTSATRGGDLGFFDEKRMVKPFSDAAFAMEIGDTSEVVETRYGLHIIKVEAIEEASVQPLDEVESEIASELYAEDRAPQAAQEFARSLVGVFDGTLDDEAAAALLDSHNLDIQETGEFDGSARTVPKLGRAPEVVNAAFALTEVGSVSSEPIELTTGWVVFRIKAATEPDDATFAEEKGDVRDRLLRTRQSRALEGFKAGLKAEATIRFSSGA